MTVDTALISKLEKLARLLLPPEQRQQLLGDLNAILEMLAKLNELDTEGVAPLTYISDAVFLGREDVVAKQVDREAALRNAPDQDGQYFKEPKVIDL
mgnify:FL=1